MKKMRCSIFILLMIFSLASCAQKQSLETKMTPNEMAKVIIESQDEFPAQNQITPENDEFSVWTSDYYLIPDGQVEDGAIYYAEGVDASEIAVLLLADEKNFETVQKSLEEYKESRVGVFEGYAPEQAALAKDGTVVSNGKYVAFLVCGDTSAAEKAFLECFGEKDSVSVSSNKKKQDTERAVSSDTGTDSLEQQSTKENEYDSAAVLQAWETGDDSNLSDRNRRILEAAREVVAQEINDSMSDYEKELAIHDWITNWSSFDYGIFGRSSEDGLIDGSDTPYGVLIDQSAMCHGYSSTFQLFMDMLKIECITVFGTPDGSGVQHSWNMVQLDGEWYCVDTAWDNPIGGRPGHNYFNVTSEFLRGGSIHRWDESSVPEATGTAYAYDIH